MKYRACAMMGILLLAAVASGAFGAKTAYAQGEWYPGEGAQEGLLMKYRVASFDYKKGQPIEITIWLESRDDKNNWNALAIAEDGGRVVSEEFTLSSITLTPVGFVSEEFQPYRSMITETLAWLGSYASKIDPKPLAGGNWGVIAAIGGGGIIVGSTGAETVQAAGNSWDAAIIGFHYGVDSSLWVVDGFPYPVRAEVFALTTQLPIPVQFEFELLETGITSTPPEVPEEKLVPPKPPITKHTTSASYMVDLYWDPEIIRTGSPLKMGIVFFDSARNLIKNAQYNVEIIDAEGGVVFKAEKVITSEGQGVHDVTFEKDGRARVLVTYLGTFELGTVEKIIEKTEFDLVVLPGEMAPPEMPPTGKQIDVSLAAKQTKRLTLISAKNNEDVAVYALQLKLTDGDIRFVKAKGWERERIDQSTVMVSTDDRPLLPGRPLIVLLLSNNPASSLEWVVLDQEGQSLGNGTTVPRAR